MRNFIVQATGLIASVLAYWVTGLLTPEHGLIFYDICTTTKLPGPRIVQTCIISLFIYLFIYFYYLFSNYFFPLRIKENLHRLNSFQLLLKLTLK